MLSPDEDFSAAGAKSGIKYDKSFLKYKEMLTEDPDSHVYKRIIAKFNASIFGTAPVLKNNFVINDGDYDSEVEQFKRDIRADPPVEDVADVRINTPSALPPPTPPLQSEHHVSVSVTSHVSHTVAASSQVLNVVNSTISLPPGQEIGGSSIQTTDPPIQQASPPIEKAPRPVLKKKGPKSSKLAATVLDPDTGAPGTRSKKAARQADSTVAGPPTRTLRKR